MTQIQLDLMRNEEQARHNAAEETLKQATLADAIRRTDSSIALDKARKTGVNLENARTLSEKFYNTSDALESLRREEPDWYTQRDNTL